MKPGVAYSQGTSSLTNTLSYPTAFNLALMLVSTQLVLPLPLIIAQPFMYIQNNTKKSWTGSLVLEDTLGPAPKPRSNSFSGLSSHRPSPSSPNRGRSKNIEQYIISLFHARHRVIYLPLITLLILICSPAHGGPSLLYAHSFGTSPKALRPQYATLLRHTTQFLSSQPSGLASSSNYESTISS